MDLTATLPKPLAIAASTLLDHVLQLYKLHLVPTLFLASKPFGPLEMFKKPLAHQSNATPLRSSARRQLLTSIFTQYPDLLPVRADEGEGPSGAALSEKDLGRLILPEGIRSVAIETSGGVEGILYTSPEGEPLWMSFGRNSKELIPTLYLLSLPLPHPPLPVLQVHHPLPPPILTGAPLFLPAVRHLPRPHLLPDVPEGAVVAFATSPAGDESVEYVGVGKVVSRGGLRGARDRLMRHRSEGVDVDEGRFCDVMCISGDHLWEMGSKPAMPTFTLQAPRTPLAPPPEGQSGPSQPRGTSLSTDQASEGIKNISLTDDNGTPVPSTPSQSGDAPPLSPSEINTLLTVSLYQALSTLQPSSFPMPASLLYSAHVLPSRPAYIPQSQRDDVVIGKSEWKKLSKWMKEASKEGLLKIKETKGEVIVTGFDPSHPGIENHAPHVTLAEEEIKVAKRAAREATATDGPTSGTTKQGKSKELVIEELWKPSGGAVSFWEACGVDKASLLPPSAIKTTADEYIAKHSQSDPRNPRSVLLDEELGRAVGVKKPAPGESLARDEVIKRLRAGVSWHVSVGGVIRKGTLSPITLTVKTRQGRKTVTHVVGLEAFGVEIDEFAEELRKLCAGSASVQPVQGVSPKLNLQEIMVQGSQVKLITESLVSRGIPKRWIKEGEGDKKKR